jgi:Asp-tRNA(Asn)/Glu-tRNA(Gln) amidotransferase A subunit family amidase
MTLDNLDAVGLRAKLLIGELSCAEAAEELLSSIAGDELNAWAAVEPDAVRARAAELDKVVPRNRGRLPLFGVPVAIKDNFDTADLPTEYGSPIYAGWRPTADAPLVSRLRDAGALIAGKAKCAEFAWMTAPDTLNPLDRSRTPGGSSSGSAAAIGAGAIPLATGTQTAGSINRPASYCGVLGYKPTFGRFSRAGVKLMAESLDTVGMFARSVRDLELSAAVLTVREQGPATAPARSPRFAFARTPIWASIEAPAREAIERAVDQARAGGASIADLDLPAGFEALTAAQTTIQLYESAISLTPELESSPDLLSDELRETLLTGKAIARERYVAAKRTAAQLGPTLASRLADFDGVLTPSADGVPPPGLAFTGDPVFCRVWTLIGAPCVSLPLAWTDAGLPAGVQLVGAPGRDSALLSAANALLG